MNTLSVLSRAISSFINGDRLPADVENWLGNALVDYVETGAPVSESLGLQNGLYRAYRRQQRDDALREAYTPMSRT